MCCLFGMIDPHHHFSAGEKSRMMSILATACEARGADATGVAYNSRGRLHIYKRPLPAHKMRMRIPEDAAVVMGHTRMATQGPAKFSKNNHPFTGQAGGTSFALAHNGVLYNDQSLRHRERLPFTSIETDSYVAVQLIEKKRTLTPDSLRYMAEQVEGSFTFTVLDEQDTLYIVKGDNPMYLVHYPTTDFYLYASTEEILTQALSMMHLGLEAPNRVEVDCGDILCIHKDGSRAVSHFSTAKLFSRWYYSPLLAPVRPKTPFLQEREEAQSEYLQELKAIAGYYGYAPESIDAMLEDGFTGEEVEEMISCGYF